MKGITFALISFCIVSFLFMLGTFLVYGQDGIRLVMIPFAIFFTVGIIVLCLIEGNEEAEV